MSNIKLCIYYSQVISHHIIVGPNVPSDCYTFNNIGIERVRHSTDGWMEGGRDDGRDGGEGGEGGKERGGGM